MQCRSALVLDALGVVIDSETHFFLVVREILLALGQIVDVFSRLFLGVSLFQGGVSKVESLFIWFTGHPPFYRFDL